MREIKEERTVLVFLDEAHGAFGEPLREMPLIVGSDDGLYDFLSLEQRQVRICAFLCGSGWYGHMSLEYGMPKYSSKP